MRSRRRTATASLWLLAASPLAGQPESGAPPIAPLFPAPLATLEFVDQALREGERLSLERERRRTTFHDERTGLLWRRTDNGGDLNWPQAERFCADLEEAGYDDWRLPTIEELESLHDRRAAKRFNTPDAVQLTACCPWSATRRTDDSIWNFNFHFRRRFSGSPTYTFDLRALCVRTPAPDEVFPAPEPGEGEGKSKKTRRKPSRW